jgi:glycerol-3-phosphate acyltransferase PlsY
MILAAVMIVAAYFLGSVPFALVIGKGIYKTDVRQSGSGNIGTTNVFRVLGAKAGLLVFAGDMAKGFLPAYIATRVIDPGDAALVAVLVAGAAIIGHNWSFFLRGRGGKGVATGGGAVLAMMPWLFLLAFGIFWLVLLVDRRVSVASLSAAIGLSVATLATRQPLPYIVFAWLGTAVVFYAHRSNIGRISKGEESRVSYPWSSGAKASGGSRGRKLAAERKGAAEADARPEGAADSGDVEEIFADLHTGDEDTAEARAAAETDAAEPETAETATEGPETDETEPEDDTGRQTEDFEWEDPAP